ncbi:hypothetical protein ACVIJ6_000857 [Bradyrhizobium sp. USDA 4369]
MALVDHLPHVLISIGVVPVTAPSEPLGDILLQGVNAGQMPREIQFSPNAESFDPGITVTVLDCTPQVRHDNLGDRHSEDDLWQQEGRTVGFRRLTS